MTDTSEQILPCPFCGDVATIDDNADYHRSNPPPVWLVGCEACNGHDGEHCRSVWMTETTKEKAIEVWNTRHSSLPPDVVAFRAGWRAAVNGLGYEGCEETEDAFPIELDEWLDTTAALRTPRQLDAKTDYRLNLAKALFEASYGMDLMLWSDETRDYWLARADAVEESARHVKHLLGVIELAADSFDNGDGSSFYLRDALAQSHREPKP